MPHCAETRNRSEGIPPNPADRDKLTDMKEITEGWVRDGKVEPGEGAWSSPAFVVPKKKCCEV